MIAASYLGLKPLFMGVLWTAMVVIAIWPLL